MKCDSFELLRATVRIANCAVHDYPQALKNILRLVARFFPLAGGGFFLLNPSGDHFDQVITAGGDDLLVPCRRPLLNTPEGQALIRRQPELTENSVHIPAFCCNQGYGVLTLPVPLGFALSHQDLHCLSAVGEELGFLARNAAIHTEDLWRMEQLAFLSDLGRQLTHARQLQDLLLTAAKSVHRQSQAACVILRPLLGDTVMGGCTLRIDSAHRKYRSRLQKLEELHAPQALGLSGPLYVSDPIDPEQADSGFPNHMVIVPLFFQHQPRGSLTLFFDGQPTDQPFAVRRKTKEFYISVGSQIAHALDRVATLERLEFLSSENNLKYRELSLLHRCFRAIHSTLNLNDLMHLMLSAATVPAGGGFERAMLFTINERSGVLQGMLGVSREGAALVFSPLDDQASQHSWENPLITPDVREAQRQMLFCQQVMQQRLPLIADDNALAQAVLQERVVFVAHPADEPPAGAALAKELQLGPYACAPLQGKNGPLGVLVVDSCETRHNLSPDRLRFLELFAHQAGSAMENSLLLQRLENVNRELRITQERLIQGEKMAVLGELSASIAHELKTPLVPIGGFARRLAKLAQPGSKQAEYSEVIIRETRRMEQILTEILAFSKKQLLCFNECRAEKIIEQALVLEDDALRRGHIKVLVETQESLPLFKGDDQKLLQVLINLIDNARHVMSNGGTLRISAFPSSLRGKPGVAIAVQDTGGGVPKEVLKEIFTPFYTTKNQGTGLGLAISQRIIEQHRGSIEIHNDEEGAVFTIHLPLSPAIEALD